MNVTCTKEKLRDAVALAEKITAKNTTLPVLSSLLLCAQNNQLIIRATNLEIGIEVTVPASIETEGIVAVPGSVIQNALTNIQTTDNITLTLQNENLHIASEHHSLLIKSLPTDDFPTIPVVEDGDDVTLTAEQWTTGINSVIYSASLSDIKPEISSVYVYPEGKHVVFVATDSIRLAEKKILTKEHQEFPGCILPLRTARELVRILEKESGDIKALFNANQISFFGRDVYLTSRVVNGTFPDYGQIIPQEFNTEATILKQDLANALKVTNIFSDKFNRVDLVADPKKKTFTLHSQNSSVGETTTHIDASLEGDALELSFNQKYISDVFQTIESDSVHLKFSGKNKPLLMNGVGDSSFYYLVMPINS